MDKNELRRQISYWLDGALHLEEVRALEEKLKASPNARHEYLQMASAHAELSQIAMNDELLDAIRDSDSTPVPAPHLDSTSRASRFPFSATPLIMFAIVACLLLGAGLWRLFNTSNPSQTDGHITSKQADPVTKIPMLTAVEPVGENCRWYVERAQRSEAQAYQPHDVIRVFSGRLALRYTNGTRIVLQSPAAYELLSVGRARMILGRLTATVDDKGKGFTIITPQADVIDLGTEFGVEVNRDGATDVVVFKGEVDLDCRDHKTRRDQRLRMGEAVRLDAIGTTSRLVWVNGGSYSSTSSVPSNGQPLIVEVRDNIERDSPMFNFYEIVTGGVKEDALAYVDRIAHEYNGITKAGIPGYLLNADYVKMFNNDKYNKTTRIEVTLSMPAKLYVLLDNRLTPPQWLTDEFQDTGDDIGLDNGPFQTNGKWHNKGPSGIGPGESIDDEMSIWVREVPVPGVVQLGPVGTTIEIAANMYGIMATPLHAQ